MVAKVKIVDLNMHNIAIWAKRNGNVTCSLDNAAIVLFEVWIRGLGLYELLPSPVYQQGIPPHSRADSEHEKKGDCT